MASVDSVTVSEQIPSPLHTGARRAPHDRGQKSLNRPTPSHHTAKIITSANGYVHPPRNRSDQCTDIEMTESLTLRCGLSKYHPRRRAEHV